MLGFGRGPAFGDPVWVERKAIDIRMDVASGLRRFYFCGHPWSFLQPTAELAVASGTESIVLPDDFGGINGGVVAVITQSSDNLGRWSAPFVNPAAIIKARTLSPEQTGTPCMLAQRPVKNMPAGKMQKNELLVYPTADQAYTLSFPYLITPNFLVDVTQPYAYGGVDHHETILEMCLAVTEQRRDNMAGQHTERAQELLQRSMMIDRRKNPTKMGQNIDVSDDMEFWPWGRQGDLNGHGSQDQGGVRYNGVLYQ